MLVSAVLAFMLLPLGTEGSHDEDCILQLEAIRGQLDHAAEGVTTIQKPLRVERGLEESIRLSDGTVVQFETGGCVHYGFSFTYPGVKLVERDFAPASARARALLERTPVLEDARGNRSILITALGSPYDTPAGPGETYLACGDAVCTLRVMPDEGRDTVTLTVSYDFPL
jgi:hypothetical protein